MSDSKDRLRKVLDKMSLDSSQRSLVLAGVEKMSNAKADEVADQLEKALADLPKATAELHAAIDETKRRQTPDNIN